MVNNSLESSGDHARENLVRCGFEFGFLYGSTERTDHPTTDAWLKRWFHLFAKNPNIVNSHFHRKLNPSDGSYSRNPFTTRPTQRYYTEKQVGTKITTLVFLLFYKSKVDWKCPLI